MQNYSDQVLFNGQPLAGASVTVLNYPSGTLATIYVDNGITVGPNPITTNSIGRWNFYAANGRYSLSIAYPNAPTQFIQDYPLEDDPASPQTANITSGTIANVAISNSTAVTQPTLDNSTLIATDAFVNNEIVRSTAMTPVTITGGTYNLNVTGTGLTFVIFVSGGVISSILSIVNGGTGYNNGDVLVVSGGNFDAIVRVTNAIGGVVQSGGLSPIYGGTGYTTGLTAGGVRANIGAGNTITLTGTLTSNATIIFIRGSFIAGANRLVINNNTTGAFTVSAFMSNGSGGTTGNGIVIPQGSNNSDATLVQTDGVNDVWYASSGLISPPNASPPAINGQIAANSATSSFQAQIAGLTQNLSAGIYTQTNTITTSGTGAVSWIGSGVGTTTIPANFLVAGTTLRIRALAQVTSAATPGTVNLVMNLGGTALANATATINASLTNCIVDLETQIIVRATGASAAAVVWTKLAYAIATASAQNILYSSGPAGAVTVNTTVSNAITISTTNSVAAGTVFTIFALSIEVIQ